MRMVRILVQTLLVAVLLGACPRVCYGGDKEDLQSIARDLESLQERLRQLEQDSGQHLSAINALFQRMLDDTGKLNTAIAVMNQSAQDRLSRIGSNPGASLRNAEATLNQMRADFRAVEQSAADTGSRIDRLDGQLQDLAKAVQSLPPPATTAAQPLTAGDSPDTLFESARRDQSAGNYSLAVQEYSDVVNRFPNSLLAANAQFHIGEIYYFQQQYDDALRAFDAFLEKYPNADRQPDGLYMKALALRKLGRGEQARRTFQELIRRFPAHDLADQARTQLRQGGK